MAPPRRFVPVGPVGAVPVGGMRAFDVDDVEIVVANVDGELYALGGRCPHQGGPLARGTLDGETLTCPWHRWTFDVRTGRPTWPEGVWRATRYPVEVRDGQILVGLF